MLLTEEQKAEIGAYISTSIRYKETYFEVLDHLVSKFENADYQYNSEMLKWEIRTKLQKEKENFYCARNGARLNL